MSNKRVTTDHKPVTRTSSLSDDFGKNLERARELLSWDRQYLIERIRKHVPRGVHENTIYNIEKGKVRGRRETVRVIREIITEALHCEYPWEVTGSSLTRADLAGYIQTSELVNRIDLALANSTGLSLVPPDSFLELFLVRMTYIGINSISEVEKRLRAKEHFILLFGENLYRKPDVQIPFIPRGACIGLVQLLEVLETKPVQELKTFLSKHSLIKGHDPETRAKAIRNAFKAAQKAAHRGEKRDD